MKQTTLLSLLYGAGIVMMLYFIIGEIQAHRLGFASIASIIPSLQKKQTGPPPSEWSGVREIEHSVRQDATLVDSVSQWIRDDPYPPIQIVLDPYDRTSIPEPTVTEVGWWGA